jgi:hypothetical protein
MLTVFKGPTAFANGPTIVELQGDWIIDAIDYCEKNGKKTMDATAQSEAGWTKHVAELCDITLFPGTDSWYMGVSLALVAPMLSFLHHLFHEPPLIHMILIVIIGQCPRQTP